MLNKTVRSASVLGDGTVALSFGASFAVSDAPTLSYAPTSSGSGGILEDFAGNELQPFLEDGLQYFTPVL